MSSQTEIAAAGNSLTPKQFKFVLQTVDAIKELKYAPQGWAEGELTFIRDKKYKGVLTKFSTNELTFVKDGKDFIVNDYELHGIDRNITIHIYLFNNGTFRYEGYFTGKVGLIPYNVDSIGVTVKISNTGFQETILNRDSIKVDMMNIKYIGGGEKSMQALYGVWEKVTFPEYQAVQNADWKIKGFIGNFPAGDSHFYFPMELNFNEYNETESFNQVSSTFFGGITEKFFISSIERTVKLNFSITINFILDITGSGLGTVIYLFKNNIKIKTYYPVHYIGTTVGTTAYFYTDESITFNINDKYTLIGYSYAKIKYSASVEISSNSFLTIQENLGSALPAINAPMFYIYEAFVRTLQLISGEGQPFYSNLLGRTDSVPESYAADGDASLIAITNGKWIRGFSPNLHGLNFSLEDLFDSINAIKNIGLGFEIINGVNKVRVEDEKYFYDISINPDFATDGKYWKTNQILDLSSHVTNEILSKEVLPELYANEIEVGYENFEYENIQGLKEFNTKSNYAIPVLSVKGKLNLISPYRADTQGVNKLRAKLFETYPTEDVGGDNDNFLFAVKRGGSYIFTVKTDEDFESAIGGVDSPQCYNLEFTPARNLRNHSSAIRGMQIQNQKELQWLKSDKNTSLVTKKAGADPIAESADILIADLTVGFWKPEAYNFEAPVNTATITAIKANPYGVIKIGVNMYGWILEVQTSDKTGKGQFKLLKVDLNNVKVVIP